jgi:hypothetical protein
LTDRLVAWALALPACAAFAAVLAIAGAERAGRGVLAGAPPSNLAEAAATGRADDVVRRLRRGEDPQRVYDLRPEAISSVVLKATTLEAAIWSRQRLMIELLDREGAIVDEAHRRELACLAADLDSPDVVEYLSPGGAPGCARGEVFNRVLARTPRREDD